MIIVNPLYDRAFKILMENDKIAKLIISVIIEQEIISLELKPQEVVITDKKRNFPILRYDFKAIIKTDEGEHKVVLIEVQKSKSPNPIIRFRRYLASNYMKTEKIQTDKGEEEKPLPIITIYFLGYNLPEYNTPAIIVNNTVTDAATKKTIDIKSEFVELLTHPSYILQTDRLPKKRKTKLEKMLTLFDQAKKADEDYLLNLADKELEDLKDLEDFDIILSHLNQAAQNEQTRLELQLEEDVEKEFERLEKLEKVVAEKELELEEERKQKEEAKLREEEERKCNMQIIKNLFKSDMDIEEISKITGKSLSEIKKITD